MNVESVLLLRVSSLVDKDVEHPQFFDPPYALKYLQAGLRRYDDVSVSILDCWIRTVGISEMLGYMAELRPDIVVISASSFDIDIANGLAVSLKKQGRPPLVIGIGQGYYVNQDRARDLRGTFDAILLGEPEQEFFQLFDHIRDKGQSSESWRAHYRKRYAQGKRFIVEAPDILPFPSYTPDELKACRSIYPVRIPRRVVWGFLIATRGCPYKCMFCSEVMRVSVGKRLRSRSASNVADEMEHLARQGVNICSFQDDTFSANRRFVRSLCEEFIARDSRMPWMARVRVDELSYDLLELMRKAGCAMLGIGVESGSERILDTMRKTEDSRRWLELCRQTFRRTRDLGIGTNAYYVIGNPTETRQEIEQTIMFAMELNTDSIQVHFYTPYPGSAAWEKYKDRFDHCDTRRMFHYATPMLSLADVFVQELVKLRAKFYRRYILRPSFAINHLRRHAAFYMHNPDVLWSLLGIRKVI